MKTLIVSGVRQTKEQGHLLSCSGQLKTNHQTGKHWEVVILMNIKHISPHNNMVSENVLLADNFLILCYIGYIV